MTGRANMVDGVLRITRCSGRTMSGEQCRLNATVRDDDGKYRFCKRHSPRYRNVHRGVVLADSAAEPKNSSHPFLGAAERRGKVLRELTPVLAFISDKPSRHLEIVTSWMSLDDLEGMTKFLYESTGFKSALSLPGLPAKRDEDENP